MTSYNCFAVYWRKTREDRRAEKDNRPGVDRAAVRNRV